MWSRLVYGWEYSWGERQMGKSAAFWSDELLGATIKDPAVARHAAWFDTVTGQTVRRPLAVTATAIPKEE